MSEVIDHECAKNILGETRFQFVLEANPGELSLYDSRGVMYVHWLVESLHESYLLGEEDRERLKAAIGFIRDQLGHDLCWAYVICDLISASRVLHGLDKEFTPLCPRYLMQNAIKKIYRNNLLKPKVVADDEDLHCCYGNELEGPLMYVKRYGIPREDQNKKKFDCCVPRPSVNREEMCRISHVYKYNTIEEALVRLKTHPVAAGLVCFDGWNKPGTYRGPDCGLDERGRKYKDDHAVLMMDCTEIEGEKVVICKSSNGEALGTNGYIIVSLEIMLISAGAARRKDGKHLGCHTKPQFLLSEFYSVDMEMTPSAKIPNIYISFSLLCFVSQCIWNSLILLWQVRGQRGPKGQEAVHSSQDQGW